MFAFWSWVAGAAAGCRCKVRLSDCCLRFGAARCCPVPGFFSFSLLVLRSRRALVGWYAFRPWPCFGCVSFFLCYTCGGAVSSKKTAPAETATHKQQHQQRNLLVLLVLLLLLLLLLALTGAASHPLLIFEGDFKGKKCMLTARAHCFLEFSNFLWFVEFIGARKESLQKTMLVMWLQRRDVRSVFHSACHTRCAFSGVMWVKSTTCRWN